MRLLLLLGLMLYSLAAQALDYRSTANPAAILYDAPSTAGKRLFVLSKGYPLEVVISVAGWSKVRDSSGALAWIETAQLAPTRNIVVKTATQIRSQAADNAPVSAQVAAGVVLPWLENINNWAKVRLPDQSVGYIRLEQVWGA